MSGPRPETRFPPEILSSYPTTDPSDRRQGPALLSPTIPAAAGVRGQGKNPARPSRVRPVLIFPPTCPSNLDRA